MKKQTRKQVKKYKIGGNDSDKRKRESSSVASSADSMNSQKNTNKRYKVDKSSSSSPSSTSSIKSPSIPASPTEEVYSNRIQICNTKKPNTISDELRTSIADSFPNGIVTDEKIRNLVQVKFELLCKIINGNVPESIKNLSITNKTATIDILGHTPYTLKVLKRLTDLIGGIKLTTPLRYMFINSEGIFKTKQITDGNIEYINKYRLPENENRRLYNQIIIQINENEIVVIPIIIPNHITIAIIHANSKNSIIEWFEPNGNLFLPHDINFRFDITRYNTYITQFYDIIQEDCGRIANKLYPNKVSMFKHPLYLCVGQRPTLQGRLVANKDKLGHQINSCTIFSMWYMFNRIIYLKKESAKQTYKYMDSIIKRDPTYISNLIYTFLTLLSTSYYDLLLSILSTSFFKENEYIKYLQLGHRLLSHHDIKYLYQTVGKTQNIHLYNALKSVDYTKAAYPGENYNTIVAKFNRPNSV